MCAVSLDSNLHSTLFIGEHNCAQYSAVAQISAQAVVCLLHYTITPILKYKWAVTS
jgi:hypothetical protein